MQKAPSWIFDKILNTTRSANLWRYNTIIETSKPNNLKTNQDTSYISVLETLEKSGNNPYNGIKWLTCSTNSSNLSNIFFAYQPRVNLFYLINIFSAWRYFLTIFLFKLLLKKSFLCFKKFAAVFCFNVFLKKWAIKSEVRNSWVTKSSYETTLYKMTSHFE